MKATSLTRFTSSQGLCKTAPRFLQACFFQRPVKVFKAGRAFKVMLFSAALFSAEDALKERAAPQTLSAPSGHRNKSV